MVGSEKSLISAYADVPVQERPSWRAYAIQEPFHVADWDADERVPARLKQGIVAQGLNIGPLVFVPLTTPHRRLGALGMSGPFGTAYSSEDIGFLRLIGRVVAFAIDDNFNLRQAEAAQRELQRQNERLQRSERELQEVIETIPVMAWSAAPDGTAEFFNWRYGTNTDIEERKGAEQAIALQNTRLELLLKLTNRVTSNLELRQVLRAISANIRELTLCDRPHFHRGFGIGTISPVRAGFPRAKGIFQGGVAH